MRPEKGHVAEWLGSGLQNHPQRFESARDLHSSPYIGEDFFFSMKPILLVDNYDSFTFNLLHYLEAEGNRDILVIKNDKLKSLNMDDFDGVVISPGPGLPEESNDLLSFIESIKHNKKVLGICLGLQAIAISFGMSLKNLEKVVHGQSKEMLILSQESILFENIPKSTKVGRYHSWVIDQTNFKSEFLITAEDSAGNIMAIEHKTLPIHAVQFHPESILTDYGRLMIKNWLKSLN